MVSSPQSARKRVAIIGSVGVPARYGGFETLAEQLVSRLRDDFAFTVYCSGRAYPSRLREFEGAQLRYWPIDANGVQSVAYDAISTAHALASSADVMLVLGVSGAVFLPVLRSLGYRQRRIIVNIDGLEWRRAKWRPIARRFLRMSERAAVMSAGTVVADNEAIASYVADQYRRTARLIEYGADHVRPVPRDNTALRNLGIAGHYAFSVCRIEPENNVHVILEAFRNASQLPLVFVGNWMRSDYGRSLRRRYADVPWIKLLDPIYEAERLDGLRGHCSLYVHGHSAGGTNPSLIEAMQLGRAIAAFDVDYNRLTTRDQAIYFSTAGELEAIIEGAVSRPLPEMGERLQELARERYSWERICQEYASLFNTCAESTDRHDSR